MVYGHDERSRHRTQGDASISSRQELPDCRSIARVFLRLISAYECGSKRCRVGASAMRTQGGYSSRTSSSCLVRSSRDFPSSPESNAAFRARLATLT